MATPGTKRIAVRLLVRLLRIGALAALGVWIARLTRSRSAPPEGRWIEGISGNGLVSGNRH